MVKRGPACGRLYKAGIVLCDLKEGLSLKISSSPSKISVTGGGPLGFNSGKR